MKIFHLSDLHLGKRLNEFSLLEDQSYILNQIIDLAREYQPQALLLSGDIYDRSQPSGEAVQLLDQFLTHLVEQKIKILLIGGNHDCLTRLAFGSALLTSAQVYLPPVFDGSVRKVSLEDEYGCLNFYLMPFLKPTSVRPFFPEENINSYSQALELVLSQIQLNLRQRNILLAHQFVRGSLHSDSEELLLGTLEEVEAEIFAAFDYVALGHLHRPQTITVSPSGSPKIRYCGSPLKYSVSEGEKSLTLLDFRAKGQLNISEIPLRPLRDVRQLKGKYAELTHQNHSDDFVHITLTDESDIFAALDKLRTIYPHTLKLEYDNQRTRRRQQITAPLPRFQPLELFSQLFQLQNNQALSPEQENYLKQLIQEIEEDQL